jgi:hypothetical protein
MDKTQQTSVLVQPLRADKVGRDTPVVVLQQARVQTLPTPTLQIIPTTYSSRISPDAAIVFDYTNHFHVLLTNTSTAPIILFEEWNSFGYYGLSFEITYPDGRTVRSVKKPRGWDKNFPSTVTIVPGGFYVFNVTFEPDIWQNSLFNEKRAGDGARCRMRAIYAIEPSEESCEEHAWTGTIASAKTVYTVWN